MKKQADPTRIPVQKIRVLNPRSRNKTKFSEIVSNIARVGLKRPITISVRSESKKSDGYDLVCGQGRLEAFIHLGQDTIPALVIDIPREERLLRSLIENLARPIPDTLELVRSIEALRQRKYTLKEIAKKIDVHSSYIAGILRLLKNGEEGLIRAVDRGRIPLHVAIQIAAANDKDIQKALAEAYEKKELRGKALIQARRIAEQRHTQGKNFRGGVGRRKQKSSEAVVKAYQRESDRQRLLIKKSEICESYLLFIVNAFLQLFDDEEFVSLLQKESLDNIPRQLAEKIRR